MTNEEKIAELLKNVDLPAIVTRAINQAIEAEARRQLRSAENPLKCQFPEYEKIVNETVVFSADGFVPVKELKQRVKLSQKWLAAYMRSRGCVADRRMIGYVQTRGWLGARFSDDPSIS